MMQKVKTNLEQNIQINIDIYNQKKVVSYKNLFCLIFYESFKDYLIKTSNKIIKFNK